MHTYDLLKEIVLYVEVEIKDENLEKRKAQIKKLQVVALATKFIRL